MITLQLVICAKLSFLNLFQESVGFYIDNLVIQNTIVIF